MKRSDFCDKEYIKGISKLDKEKLLERGRYRNFRNREDANNYWALLNYNLEIRESSAFGAQDNFNPDKRLDRVLILDEWLRYNTTLKQNKTAILSLVIWRIRFHQFEALRQVRELLDSDFPIELHHKVFCRELIEYQHYRRKLRERMGETPTVYETVDYWFEVARRKSPKDKRGTRFSLKQKENKLAKWIDIQHLLNTGNGPHRYDIESINESSISRA